MLNPVSAQDRTRWDQRYTRGTPLTPADVAVPAPFSRFAEMFPTSGHALDLACGRGLSAIWLAQRGMSVFGLDISPVAIADARDLAQRCGVDQQCRFEVTDLDGGLPPGPPAEVIVCHMFRDPRLDRAILQRLVPGGLLAVSALSEVGAHPGPFRVRADELETAFAALEVIAAGAGDGTAWLLGRR
ncbi:class I SAM-dependent methyltransferase [Mycolicibacterium mengxianglii]|uniref:class I SAM-dependent methyltransferase n=1 Tax=Mycolicibacterium mengxianglii TaxID=2736649 RepID=UPI0038CC112D